MSIAQNIKRLYESYGPTAHKRFADALKTKKIDADTISIADLRETFLGRSYIEVQDKLGKLAYGKTHLMEASSAVDASNFMNITGQLLVTLIKEKYESVEFIGDKLVKKMPNPGANLREHKIPYLSDVADKGEKLSQQEVYPYTKFDENYVEIPAPEKYGRVCAVSMEALYSDLTGQIQDSARSIGLALGYQREERILKTVLGIDNTYKWNGSTLNTYVSTSGTGKYVNKLLSNTITNWKHINDIEQLFWKMVDPITGRAIFVRPTTLIVDPAKRYELKRILSATTTRAGDITTGAGDQNEAANPLEISYAVLTSPIASKLQQDAGISAADTKERVYFGDFTRAFGYREVYPMQTTEAPSLNPDEFKQDIALTVKVSEFGVPFVYDPRFVALSTAEAS